MALSAPAARDNRPMQLSAADYVILIVADIDRSLRFYTEVLGLPLAHRSGSYAQLATGATRLGFYERPAMEATLGTSLGTPDPFAPAFEIGFKVDDVDAAYAELVEAGAVPAAVPVTRPWGQRTAYVRDPDGYLVELAQDLR